ncbi:MAG TPA: RecX family transcriptional regulator [Anaerolineaceae bacterium]|nr:RecX family transcriptional regulator [Anaerolineaceae bacterium]
MVEHKITALKVQKKNPNRVNVYLDGEYAFGLARIVAAWLSIGQRINDEQIDRLVSQDVSEVAFQTALTQLSYRARSEAELRKKLAGKGFSETVISAILDRLKANGMVNDTQFAQAWVENQSTFRPRGRRLLKLELRLKGLGDETIQEALDEAEDEEALAYQAALRPAKRYADLEWADFRLKVSQFLTRRGFSYETIAPIVSSLWAENHLTDIENGRRGLE